MAFFPVIDLGLLTWETSLGGFYQIKKKNFFSAAKVRITSFIWHNPQCPGGLAHTSAQPIKFRGPREVWRAGLHLKRPGKALQH